MTTKKPRVNLTVPEPLHEAIKHLSNATGAPKSEIILSFLEPMQDYIEITASLVEKVNQMPARDKPKFERLVRALEFKYQDRMLHAQEAIEDMQSLLSGEKTEVQLDLKEYLVFVDHPEIMEGSEDAA